VFAIRWIYSALLAVRRALAACGCVIADVHRYLVGLATQDDPPRLSCFSTAVADRPVKMLLSRPGHIEDVLATTGQWEPHVTQALCFFMSGVDVFVDVGANIGYHALYVASVFPGARVVAFEPNPVVRAQLQHNAALCGFANVEISGAAVSDRAGAARLFGQRARAYNRGNSSLRRNPDLGTRYDQVDVEVVTLDTALAGQRVRVIKIDTEGHEYEVLRGAGRLIEEQRPVILFEFESRYAEDAPAALSQILALIAGYRVFVLTPDGMRPLDPAAARHRWFRADLLCLPHRVDKV
jgi:FkbM family methyltransferase